MMMQARHPAPGKTAFRKQLLSATIASLLLAGSATGIASEDRGATGGASAGKSLGRSLDRLAPPATAMEETRAPGQNEVLERYRRIEGRSGDGATDAAIQQRMAELEMAAGEERDMAGESQPYAAAIVRYESLLDRSTGEALQNTLYQLARAYDVSGQSARALTMFDRLLAEFPQNPWRIEALFRRAEIRFSGEDYESAALDYALVVDEGGETPFHQNARYMLGWSWFKQSAFDEAIDQFLPLIGDLSAEDRNLSRAERELLDDALRVSVLSLQYLEGPTTLAARMAALGRPDWQSVVYEQLAGRYVAQERWQEGARTWSTFVEENPTSAAAADAQQSLIDVLEAGKFPTDARREKERYVALFGSGSAWRQGKDDNVLGKADETLKSHLALLANQTHVDVQERARKQTVGSDDYLAAARWYETSLQTFPDAKDAPRQLLLLGDLYTQAGDHRRALAAYRQLVDEHSDAPEATDAAYATVLGLRKLHEQGQNGEPELSLRMLVDAQIGFAMDHRDDPRAASVQAAAANDLFTLQEYDQAMTLSANLLESWPAAAPDLKSTALTILGHSRFETGDFAGAEAAYAELLQQSTSADKRAPLIEKQLAAVYKQGEMAERAGDADVAIGHYLRLSNIAPAAEIAVRGAFDAVALKEKAGDLEGAARLLADLRGRHGGHALLKDADVRLATMYEQSGESSQAAAEMARIADSGADSEVLRQSRYRAGELYLLAGDTRSAIQQFERYVADHDEPAATRVEAMQQLADLAAKSGNTRGQRQWQQKLIAAWENSASARSPRTATLAAKARYDIALDDRAAFDQVALRAPLAASLKQKSQRLQKAVASFEAVVNYQVQETTTAATFQIADLYKSLAGAILASQRPAGLSPEELEEYNLLLEEEAYPFEEKAIEIHEVNSQRSWEGVYDEWVQKSFAELKRMLPGRFDKNELELSDVGDIH